MPFPIDAKRPTPSNADRPMSPAELSKGENIGTTIPTEVFNVFNMLINQNQGSNGRAHVKQNEVVAELVKLGFNEAEIFAKRWLDVEPLYRKAGWDVSYDKPGWDESYEPYFIFKPKN
ncbi:hypothetical protein KBC79_03510 [Candidatus Woesebacteria bacterium]|nr:hypothetical protein [Candidatus Woesebacteria bacterium]